MKYVTIQKMSELTGYTVGALRRKIERGQLIQGVHYIKAPDGRIHFNTENFEAWLLGERPELKRAA